MAAHNELGKWGEEIAAKFLSKKGYAILARDWRSGSRDIDIVARDGNVIVFVEVKTRRNQLFADPWDAVGYKKLYNLALAIHHYVNYYRIDNEIRLDLVCIVGMIGEEPQIEHFIDIPLR